MLGVSCSSVSSIQVHEQNENDVTTSPTLSALTTMSNSLNLSSTEQINATDIVKSGNVNSIILNVQNDVNTTTNLPRQEKIITVTEKRYKNNIISYNLY